MELNVGKEVAVLKRMTVNELRGRFAEVFGEPTQARHKDWLIKRIAWRLQAQAEGDLSQRARQRAAELARDADLRLSSPRPKAISPAPADSTKTASLRIKADDRLPVSGTVITRSYKGETVQVKVLPNGFEFEGEVFKSLSAVAKKVTGSHCNGYLFFRLGQDRGDR